MACRGSTSSIRRDGRNRCVGFGVIDDDFLSRYSELVLAQTFDDWGYTILGFEPVGAAGASPISASMSRVTRSSSRRRRRDLTVTTGSTTQWTCLRFRSLAWNRLCR